MRVVITGANRGIGLGLVGACLDRGDEVHATARRPDSATELAALRKKAAGRLSIHPLDVTQEDDARALSKELGKEGIDVLFNNAGVGEPWNKLDDLDMTALLNRFDINALGPVRVAKALHRQVAAARGKIINITSLMGSIDDNRSGHAWGYRMSKAALNMATKNMALELEPEGVTVVAVHPGWVKTDMGGAQAPVPVGNAVRNILDLVDHLALKDTGKFFHAEGRELPW
jgi:NAD(P)-dependent dehydrogenase (short-subunit alcohol dehydrogenase family)